jgi:hypothetical protein
LKEIQVKNRDNKAFLHYNPGIAMTKVIRISELTYQKVNQLSKSRKISKKSIIEKAVERLAREDLLNRGNESHKPDKKHKSSDKSECSVTHHPTITPGELNTLSAC